MISALLRAAGVAPLVAIVLLGTQVAAHDYRPAPIERFVVFGDSLSDPGNAFVATGEVAVRPFEPIPSAPYLIGRFHFTNGPTWVEQLARDFDLFRSARPALLRPGVFTNYAIGGARAHAAEPIDLATLIGLFLADFDGVAAPESLYVLWIGANDLRDAFAAFEQDPSGETSEAIIQEALRATKRGIKDLYDAGARSFLVLNLPNIGDTPALRALGPPAQALVRQLAVAYNGGLEARLERLDGLPGIAIARFDVFDGLEELVQDPALAGLRNVADSCITPGVIIGAICRNPRRYLFWDFIHPTRRAHRYLSEQAQGILEAEFFIAAPPFRDAPQM